MSDMVCIKVTKAEDEFRWSVTFNDAFVEHGAAPSKPEAVAYAAVAVVRKFEAETR
jgi:hypothetical protein